MSALNELFTSEADAIAARNELILKKVSASTIKDPVEPSCRPLNGQEWGVIILCAVLLILLYTIIVFWLARHHKKNLPPSSLKNEIGLALKSFSVNKSEGAKQEPSPGEKATTSTNGVHSPSFIPHSPNFHIYTYNEQQPRLNNSTSNADFQSSYTNFNQKHHLKAPQSPSVYRHEHHQPQRQTQHQQYFLPQNSFIQENISAMEKLNLN